MHKFIIRIKIHPTFLHLCKLSLHFTNQNFKGLGSVNWPGHNSLYN